MAGEVRRARYRFDADDRTKGALESMDRNLGKANKALVGYAAGFAGIVGAGAVGAFVRGQMLAIDSLAKQADRLNISTEALAAYEHAAALAGLETDQFSLALQKQQTQIGLAVAGNVKAAKSFEQLGLNVEDLTVMTADAQFDAIAEKIRGVGNASQQAAFASKIFGESAAAIVNFINEGPEGLEAAARETQALGVALSRIDAAKVEEANDNIDRAKGVFTGLGNTIAVAVSPVISALADRFVDSAVEADGFKGVVDSAMRFVAQAAGYTANVIRGIEVAFKMAQIVGQGFGAAVLTAIDLILGNLLRLDVQLGGFLNRYIRAINGLGDLEIPEYDTGPSERAAAAIGGTADAARERLVEMQEELKALVMEPLPHANVVAFFDEAARAAEASAEKVAAAKRTISQVFTPEENEKELGKLREQMAGRLDALVSGTRTETEALLIQLEERRALLDEAEQMDLANEVLLNDTRLRIEAEYQEKLAEIQAKNATDLEKFEAASWSKKVDIVSGSLEEMTAGVANHSKTMFKINKAAAIASAIVNTSEAVTKALSAYPPPVSFAMAAAQLAAGVAQVNAIRSTQFGGGTTPSTAGRTATYNGQPVGARGNVATGDALGSDPSAGGRTGFVPPRKEIFINGLSDGDLLSGRAVRQLIDQINREAGDGVRVTVRGGSGR